MPNTEQQNRDRALIIVPAYNERDTVGEVLRDLRDNNPGNWDLLVVNDCSTDDTAEVARQFTTQVIDLPINLGIGGCVQTGFKYAAQNGYGQAIQLDSDGQHQASEIGALTALLNNCNVVVGSRFLSRSSDSYLSTPARRLGIAFLSALGFALTRRTITDPTSGFRAYDRTAIALLAKNYPHHFPEPEALILFHKHKLMVSEVAVTMLPRQAGRSSLEHRAIFYMLNVVLGMLMVALRRVKTSAETDDL